MILFNRARRRRDAEVNIGNQIFNKLKRADLPATFDFRGEHKKGIGYSIQIFRVSTNEVVAHIVVDRSRSSGSHILIRDRLSDTVLFLGTSQEEIARAASEAKFLVDLLPR